MAPPNPRVLKAFRAMKDLGIAEEVTKPVLKNLLKLYDKNWELIEEENYRALVDAIFDSQDSAEAEKKKNENSNRAQVEEKDTQVQDESVRPLKRLRLKHQGDQASPSLTNPSSSSGGTELKKLKVEADELGKAQAGPQHQMQLLSTPQKTNLENSRTGALSVPARVTRSRVKQIVSSQPVIVQEKSKESIEPMVDAANMVHAKRKVPSSCALIKPKDEPCTDDIFQLEVPITVIPPDPLSQENSSTGNAGTREPDDQLIVTPYLEQNIRNEVIPVYSSEKEVTCKNVEVPDESGKEVEIASSALGEVKISLSCNSAIGRPDFHMPNLDEVIKAVEAQCLRSYKSLDPSFSLRKLMKDMCECFLAVGTGSNNESQQTLDVSSAIDLLKSNSALDSVIATGRPVIPLNQPIDIPSDDEVPIAQVPRLPPPCSGINDIVQHNEDDADKNLCVINKECEIDDIDHSNSQSIVVFQNQHSSDANKFVDDVYDIAKGHERVTISFANEVNSECPPSFRYIPQNVVFQNAYVNFSLARIGENCCATCSDNCLLSLTPCACSHETGGDYAYTLDGLVKEELLEECISMNRDPKKHCLFYCKECPLERSKNEEILEACKGHLVRKFIKECWWKCGCSKQCGNRVVQRGISRKLQVFMTPGGKGWGLRTLEDLPKGAFVCEYVGEVLTNAELYDRVSESPSNQPHSYPVLLDADWGAERVLKDEEALCLDATHYGNVARFINHRCFDSTMVEIPVEVETPDHHYYHLAFFTTREVKALEELTWDYGIDFDDHEHPVKAFRCRCGSKFCRNIKRSSRSRSGAAKK